MRSTCPDCNTLLVSVREDSGGSYTKGIRYYCPKAIGAHTYNPVTRRREMPAGNVHTTVVSYSAADLVRLDMKG